MGLFSSLRKDKRKPAADDSLFQAREDSMTDRRAPPNRRTRKTGKREGMDPVLPEKKRARRRLLGAIALVLAAVILVPMVFDSEPQPLATDIAINIPSKELPARQEPADAGGQQGEADPADAGAAPAPDTQPSAAARPEEIPAAPPSPAPAGGTSLPPAPPAAAPVPPAASAPPPEKPAPAPAAPAPAKPAPAPEMDEYSRAQAILSGKIDNLPAPAAKPAAPAMQQFVVQVAALSSEEKVQELQNQLSAAGIQSFTQRISTSQGPRIRVRVGPFASRDEAETMRVRVSKLGLGGSVVPA